MKRKLFSNKGYGIFTLVISLVLLFSLVLFYQGIDEKSNLNDTISTLNSTISQLEEENLRLKAGLEEKESILSESDRALHALEEEKKLAEESLYTALEENTRLQESLLEEQKKKELFIYKNLVRVKDIDASVVVDLKYATDDNFTNTRVYPTDAKALLRLETALKLKRANERFEKDGYRIKIWDAYRPKSVQEIFWALVPDPRYVADPAKGSVHNRGASVDITLVDSNGKELLMPTDYDDFSEKASRSYTGSDASARENMKYMEKIMTESGFTGLPSEWWHFDDKSGSYPLLDADFSIFN